MTRWVTSPHQLVHAWLGAKRIVDERPVDLEGHAASYGAVFASAVRILGIEELQPLIHVTRTAQATSETMRLPSGQPIVIYDQYQGRVYNRMNRFLFEDFPHDLVVRFCLRHMRIALFTSGNVPAAAYVGLLLKGWPLKGERSPEPPVPADAEARLMYTTLQEWFVIAHEVAHLAIEAGKVEAELFRVIDLAVMRVAHKPLPERLGEYLDQEDHDDDVAGVSAVVGTDAAPELRRGPRTEADLEGMTEFRKTLPTVIDASPHIREEALCDVLAAMVVIEISRRVPEFVIPALRLALSNHTTLTGMCRRAVACLTDEAHPEASDLVHQGLRGWIFVEIWTEMIEMMRDEEAVTQFGKMMALQGPRHDRRVRSIADWAPFLVFDGQHRGLFEATSTTSWPMTWVLHDIFEEMGVDGIASPSSPSG